MKNKKGFTLIELTITIAIIGILLMVIVPAISRYIIKGRDNYNNSVKESIVQIAKDYYSNNSSELPKGQANENGGINYFSKLTLATLKSDNYVSENVVDAKKNTCDNSFVIVENVNGKYDYHACMICGGTNYSNDDAVCDINIDLNGSAPSCEILYNNSTEEIWANKEISLTINGKADSGIAFFKIDNNVYEPSEITNSSGEKLYQTTYNVKETKNILVQVANKTGQLSNCSTTVNIDKDKPTCTIIKENITTEKVTLKVNGTDQTSSIKNITIEGNILEGNSLYSVTKNGNYVATVTDLAGNSNTCNVDVNEFDSTAPVITLSVSGGNNTATINATITDNVGVTGYSITESKDVPTSWTDINSTLKATPSFVKTEAKTYYVHAKDDAGNTSYKEITLKLSSSSVCDCNSWSTSCSSWEGEPCTTSGGGCTSCSTCNPSTGGGSQSCNSWCFINTNMGILECSEYCSNTSNVLGKYDINSLIQLPNFGYKVEHTLSCSCGCASYAPTTTTCTTYSSCSDYCTSRKDCWLSN